MRWVFQGVEKGYLGNQWVKKLALLENYCFQKSNACCVMDVFPHRKYKWDIYDESLQRNILDIKWDIYDESLQRNLLHIMNCGLNRK